MSALSIITLVALTLIPMCFCVTTPWVYIGSDGRLVYQKTATGDQILDFSSAGYGGGGVAIPTNIPIFKSLSPSGGDDTLLIQRAINDAASLPLVNGFRGVILLTSGTFTVKSSLQIKSSGIIIRGSSPTGTRVVMQPSSNPYTLFTVQGTGSYKLTGTPVSITDKYVPAGTSTINVADGSKLRIRQPITISRTMTSRYAVFMGMDKLEGGDTWIAPGTEMVTERVIKSINGNTITLDVPMPDSIDTKYLDNPRVQGFTFEGRISQVGIESLTAVCSQQTTFTPGWGSGVTTFAFIDMEDAMDSWVQNIVTEGLYTPIKVQSGNKQVTIRNFSVTKATPVNGSHAKSFVINIGRSTQILIESVTTNSMRDIFFVSTEMLVQGPLVVRNCKFSGDNNNLQPHMRWSVGLLVENTEAGTGASIEYINRGTYGSGHGWSIGKLLFLMWVPRSET
jgi:hypothetical protein